MFVAHYLICLQLRGEAIAENYSVPGKAGLDLNDTLDGLDLVGRSCVKMPVERIRAFLNDPDENPPQTTFKCGPHELGVALR